MAFKMKGFNPGKGTGMSNGFSRVTLNPATRDDPEGIMIGNPDGMGGATVDNETREDIKKKKKDSETDEMMFDDLTNRLEEYKNDPYRVQILPQGAKLKESDFKNWLKSNEEQLKKDKILPYNYEFGKSRTMPTRVRSLFRQKMDESRNIDNDLRLSADKGYGFDENQLANYGVYGDDFNIDQNQFDGGDNVVSLDVSEYTPNPQMAGNIERNQTNLNEVKRQERNEQRFNFHKDALDRAIRQGRNPGPSTIKAMKETDPEYYKSVVEPYLNMNKKQEKNWDEDYASNEVYDAKKGGGIDAWERHLNPQPLKDTKDPIRPGEGMLVDATDKKDDATLADMDNMAAEQEQPIETAVEEPTVEEPTVEAEQSFDPRDTNKDGEVDRFEMKAAKRAAMFADQTDPQSAMTKAILMNADSNPFKFGTKDHENFINNRNRAKGLTIKQRYNKFL
jgi:hypothetical protein